MPILETNGVQLHYDVHGEGQPLVLAHGYCASRAMWRHQLPRLARRYRVIAYDARGHGASDAPAGPAHYTLQRLVGDLHALLEALDIGRAHLVGHSMGGATVAAYASAQPDRVRCTVICNIDAGHQRWQPDEESHNAAQQQWKLRFARDHGVEALAAEQLARGLVPAFVTERADEYEAFMARYRQQPLDGYLGVGMALPWREPWLEEAARQIQGPVCIVAGDDDPLHSGARRLHEALPGSCFVLLPGAPHDSMNALPSEFNEALLGFLTEVDARPDAAAT